MKGEQSERDERLHKEGRVQKEDGRVERHKRVRTEDR